MECVDIIDILLAFVDLPLDPVPVEISKEVVNVFSGRCIAAPFTDIVCQEGFVVVLFRLFDKGLKVLVEIVDEPVVKFLTQQMR